MDGWRDGTIQERRSAERTDVAVQSRVVSIVVISELLQGTQWSSSVVFIVLSKRFEVSGSKPSIETEQFDSPLQFSSHRFDCRKKRVQRPG